MNLSDNLLKAHDVISSRRKNSFAKIYPFTTENLEGYLSKYDFTNKSVLTLGSSADQIINSYIMGAKSVDSFDINPFVKYYFDLKIAAIKALSYEEFFDFFCYLNYPIKFHKNKETFSFKLYLRLREYLPCNSRDFWDKLYNHYFPSIIRKKLFCDDEYYKNVVIKFNRYLFPENFNAIKNGRVNFNPNFITGDFRNIKEHLKNRYDIVILSNLACFIETMYEYPLRDFYDNIMETASFLNPNGVLFLAYLYDTTETTKTLPYWDLIYHLKTIFNLFKEHDVSLMSFTGVKGLIHDDENFKDSVLVYKK